MSQKNTQQFQKSYNVIQCLERGLNEPESDYCVIVVRWRIAYVCFFFVCKDEMSQVDVDHIQTTTDGDGFFGDVFTMAWP